MIERGKWLVLRVDGTRVQKDGKPTISEIYSAIGCTCLDGVVLTRNESGVPAIVMLVDDTGMLDGKPVNAEATRLYTRRCGSIMPGRRSIINTPRMHAQAIHGDVAIVNDEDFA